MSVEVPSTRTDDKRHSDRDRWEKHVTKKSKNLRMSPNLSRSRFWGAGFTLIELMVALAILAILVMMAVPSLRAAMVRNEFSSISSEFSAGVIRARNEAVSKNTCTTMCMSADPDAAEPVCSTSGKNWQTGWIVFLNPGCTAAPAGPDEVSDLILARRTGDAAYLLEAKEDQSFTFNAQGRPGTVTSKQFSLIYQAADSELSSKYGSIICVDGMGRTRSVALSAGKCE